MPFGLHPAHDGGCGFGLEGAVGGPESCDFGPAFPEADGETGQIGGATANNALLQFQSDLLRVPVVRPRTTETTALGAAYLAGLAVGFWKSRVEIARFWSADRTFRPKAAPAVMRRMQAEWHRAVDRAKCLP